MKHSKYSKNTEGSVVINYLLDTNDANITEYKMFSFILQLNC